MLVGASPTNAREQAPTHSTVSDVNMTERVWDRLGPARDVQSVLRDGAAVHGSAMVLRGLTTPGAHAAGTVVASKRIGGAVQRNRAKRRLREALRAARAPEGMQVVAIARHAALTMPMDDLVREAGMLTNRLAGRAPQGPPQGPSQRVHQ